MMLVTANISGCLPGKFQWNNARESCFNVNLYEKHKSIALSWAFTWWCRELLMVPIQKRFS